MENWLEELLNISNPVYAFYEVKGILVCAKHPQRKRYFIDDGKCSCYAFKNWGKCKHINMLKGIWTPPDGVPSWFEAELGDLFPDIELPEAFNTAVIKKPLETYWKLCTTITYKQFSMGIEVVNPEKLTEAIKDQFDKVLNEQTIRKPRGT